MGWGWGRGVYHDSGSPHNGQVMRKFLLVMASTWYCHIFDPCFPWRCAVIVAYQILIEGDEYKCATDGGPRQIYQKYPSAKMLCNNAMYITASYIYGRILGTIEILEIMCPRIHIFKTVKINCEVYEEYPSPKIPRCCTTTYNYIIHFAATCKSAPLSHWSPRKRLTFNAETIICRWWTIITDTLLS